LELWKSLLSSRREMARLNFVLPEESLAMGAPYPGAGTTLSLREGKAKVSLQLNSFSAVCRGARASPRTLNPAPSRPMALNLSPGAGVRRNAVVLGRPSLRGQGVNHHLGAFLRGECVNCSLSADLWTTSPFSACVMWPLSHVPRQNSEVIRGKSLSELACIFNLLAKLRHLARRPLVKEALQVELRGHVVVLLVTRRRRDKEA